MSPVVKFLARRVAYSLVVLFGVLVVVFALVQLVPGDPVRIAQGRAEVFSRSIR